MFSGLISLWLGHLNQRFSGKGFAFIVVRVTFVERKSFLYSFHLISFCYLKGFSEDLLYEKGS